MLLSVLLEESVLAVLLSVLVLEVFEWLLLVPLYGSVLVVLSVDALEVLVLLLLSIMVEFMVSELKLALAAVGSLLIAAFLAGGISLVILTYGRRLFELFEVVLSMMEVLLEIAVSLMMLSFVGITGLLVVLLIIDVFLVVLEVLVRLVVTLLVVLAAKVLLVTVLFVTVLLVTVLLVTGSVVAE